MDNLDRYAQYFDTAYPDYADTRYVEINQLMSLYDAANTLNIVQSSQFVEFVSLVRPLIAIKNYKSQIPFPEQLQDVIECIIRLKQAKVGRPDVFANHSEVFEQLISFQGFQLPTVSAFFHFCHSDSFPIVDVNVKGACALLKQRFPREFLDLEEPTIPAPNTSTRNKLQKYSSFITFIDRVIALQKAHRCNVTYRYIDKALMVLGVPELRKNIEKPEATGYHSSSPSVLIVTK